MGDLLRHLTVEVVRVPILHKFGRDKAMSWNNVFYILHVIPTFSSGEILAATPDSMAWVHATVMALSTGLLASPPGDVHVFTEHRLLSVAYEILGTPTGMADPRIRRLWTALQMNNVTTEHVDRGRCAWHLPMEKTGFLDLPDTVKDRGSRL